MSPQTKLPREPELREEGEGKVGRAEGLPATCPLHGSHR
jgi:hypothetical protein